MLNSVIKIIGRLQSLLGAIASLLLIGLVLLMAYNVIARYAFSASSLGLEELTWHFYASIFLLGIPYALKDDGHVRVDLIFEKLSPKKQAAIDLTGTLIFLIPSCIIIVWAGWNFTISAYQLGNQPESIATFFNQLTSTGIGEKSQDPGGLLNRWIIKGVIPISFVCLLLAGIRVACEKIVFFKTTPPTSKQKVATPKQKNEVG